MPYRRSAFTLIELMISVALGSLIVLTAMTGVRMASSAVTTSQRMAIENSLLRAGMEAALEEADFWTASDNPDPGEPKPLRAVSGGAGLPFSDFRDVGFIDNVPGPIVEDPTRARSGWNANPLAWSACDPRTWTRANVAEESSPASSWGTFGIYGHVDGGRAWHSWYDNQVRGLIDALGFFGMFEYLPSNGFAVYHGNTAPKGATSGAISWGGVPVVLTDNGLNWLCPSDGGDNTMKGRIRNSNGSRYYLPGPQAATVGDARSLAKIGYEARDVAYNAGEVTRFLDKTRVATELLSVAGKRVAPGSWPGIGYRVHRLIERGHPVTLCVVTSTSSLTGAELAIPFTCSGTTLRGARQQRRPAPQYGWADPFTDRTLDYETPP
jgi:prepilin-type N-terminal cleavage/methylation domain-containing protein